jgi:hypothetical protein
MAVLRFQGLLSRVGRESAVAVIVAAIWAYCALGFGAEPQLWIEWAASPAEDLAHYTVYRDAGDYWPTYAEGLTSGSVLLARDGVQWSAWPSWAASQTTFTAVGETFDPGLYVGGLEERTTYTFFVTASDRSGNESLPSALAWAETPDRTAPATIESLRIVEAAKTSDTVTVRFDVRVDLKEVAP